jgi:hypothetical protein
LSRRFSGRYQAAPADSAAGLPVERNERDPQRFWLAPLGPRVWLRDGFSETWLLAVMHENGLPGCGKAPG